MMKRKCLELLPRGSQFLPILASALSACAPSLSRSENPDAGTGLSHIQFSDEADGSTRAAIDATSSTEWVYFSLDRKREVDGRSDPGWDIAFRRFIIRSNGGSSGNGGVHVAALSGVQFSQVTRAPASGYVQDQAGAPDAGGDPPTAFLVNGGWYDYDPPTHRLTPRAVVYVVHSTQRQYFKLEILSYYDAAGTPATFSLHFAQVSAAP